MIQRDFSRCNVFIRFNRQTIPIWYDDYFFETCTHSFTRTRLFSRWIPSFNCTHMVTMWVFIVLFFHRWGSIKSSERTLQKIAVLYLSTLCSYEFRLYFSNIIFSLEEILFQKKFRLVLPKEENGGGLNWLWAVRLFSYRKTQLHSVHSSWQIALRTINSRVQHWCNATMCTRQHSCKWNRSLDQFY